MSVTSIQTVPVAGSAEAVLETPLPYAVQALFRVIDEGLNMPEPEIEPDDEGAYLTAVARRMDKMRELLSIAIQDPSMQNAVRVADEMNRWVTAQSLTYRPLVHDETDMAMPELDRVTA